LNETLLTKPADISGYSPLDLAGGTGYRFERIGTKRQLPVSTREEIPSRQPRCR